MMSPNGQSAIPKIVQKKHTFRVFGFIATLMIVGSLFSFGGVFFYKTYAQNNLDSKKAELGALVSEDVTNDIRDLEEFDRKLTYAQMLLNQHLAPSRLFDLLEKHTKDTVQLVSLEYSYDPGFQALLDIGGGTDAVASVAAQNLEFMKKTLFTDFVTNDITIGVADDESSLEQDVTFAISGALDKNMIAYTGATVVPMAQAVLPEVDEPVSVEVDALETEEFNNDEVITQ